MPLIIKWLEKASNIEMHIDLEPTIGFEPRKLSCIYQFVSGLPVLFVETRLRKELEDLKVAESRNEGDIAKLQERKKEIMQRLGTLAKA